MYSKLISWRNVVQGIIRPTVIVLWFSHTTSSCTLHQVEQLLRVSQSHQNFLVSRKQIAEVNCTGSYMWSIKSVYLEEYC